MGRRRRSPSPDDAELPPLRRPDVAPTCPQMVDPCIDVLAHCLIRRLGAQHAASGIRHATYSLLQPRRPVVMILTTESTAADALTLNLASLANAVGVPVVWALSREHMGLACGSPRPASACAVLGVPDEHADGLLHAMLKRAEAASAAWMLQIAEPISCL